MPPRLTAPEAGGEVDVRPVPAIDERPRLEWLDALRGIAVLAVVVEHLTYLFLRDLRYGVLVPWFDTGKYGVMVFFLVSGYIVPASLERHGSLRKFWTGRAFRLYPLLAVAVGALLVLIALGWGDLDGRLNNDALTSILAHATFLQDVLGVQNFLNVLWTLSYEMVFYLLVTALFVARAHRFSAPIALGLGLGSLLLAPVLPAMLISHDVPRTRWVVGIVAVLLVAGPWLVVRQGAARLAGAFVLGGVAVALVAFNQRAGMWEGLIILAVMFTGTAIYRAEHRQIGRGTAIGMISGVWALTVLSGVSNFHLWPQVTGVVERNYQQSWTVAMLATGLTFAGAWALRRRRFPRALVRLGLISYSIYLMHTVLLSVFHHVFDDHVDGMPLAAQTAFTLLFLAVLLAVAGATYKYVELPGQKIGRRVTADMRRRPVPAGTG
ncbi:MAG: acyltransferase family protein [Streptosporangiales bacterium]|nr:acyltransferase family protein [Streptosporangiales bacterium]